MTVTGSYAVVKGKYGKRSKDKPLWWIIAYHAGKAAVQIAMALILLGIAAWAQQCGITLPKVLP
jgi:hypothetical protein